MPKLSCKLSRSIALTLSIVLSLPIAAILATGTAGAQPFQSAPIDIAVTYTALHTNQVSAQTLWMHGGAIELGARLYRGLGIAARVEGGHAGPASPTTEPLSLVTAVFGPRFSLATRSRRCTLFGEALLGESNGFHSLFSVGSGPSGSATTGTTSSSNSMAIEAGGGLDLFLGHHLGIRAIQANYLRTNFPNSTTNIQNSFSLGAGLVLRFGK